MIDSSSPNQPIQNYEIVNSGLEAQVAALLPSVAGYGGNLRSTNTIIPVVDLTAAAEGSNVPESLQQALNFGGATAFDVNNASTTIINSTGFWRITGSVTVQENASAPNARIDGTDGVSTKTLVKWQQAGSGSTRTLMNSFDYIVFAASGVSYIAVSSATPVFIAGSVRQVASIDGTLVTPVGF